MSDNPWVFALQTLCCLLCLVGVVGYATHKFLTRGWH